MSPRKLQGRQEATLKIIEAGQEKQGEIVRCCAVDFHTWDTSRKISRRCKKEILGFKVILYVDIFSQPGREVVCHSSNTEIHLRETWWETENWTHNSIQSKCQRSHQERASQPGCPQHTFLSLAWLGAGAALDSALLSGLEMAASTFWELAMCQAWF